MRQRVRGELRAASRTREEAQESWLRALDGAAYGSEVNRNVRPGLTSVEKLRSNRCKMKQLRAVCGQVQIQSLVLQIVAITLILLIAQQILRPPVAPGQALDGQRRQTLSAMARQIHDHKVKAIRLRLPLHNDKILCRGIVRPGRALSENFAGPSSHSA